LKLSSSGIITYDPVAGKAKNAWWVIIECDKEILNYYHYWILKEKHVLLNKPLFGSHISVIRGEEPNENRKILWKKQHGENIKFVYSHELETDGNFWWLAVKSSALSDLRSDLGLSKEIEFGFHLTIGKNIK
jgi:hypothetical protein